MWIASIEIFGSTRNSQQAPTVFNKTHSLKPITQEWLSNKSTIKEGFVSSTLFSEGKGAHDLCQKTNNRLLKSGNKTHNWLAIFKAVSEKSNQALDEQMALDLATKLVLTDPSILSGWNGGVLLENDISYSWAAAYALFGCAWKAGVKFGSPTESKPSNTPEPKSALKKSKFPVTTPPETPAKTEMTPTTIVCNPHANPYYVEKLPPVAPSFFSKTKVWKEVTYLKAKLNGYWDRDTTSYSQAMTKMLTEWGTLLDILFA